MAGGRLTPHNDPFEVSIAATASLLLPVDADLGHVEDAKLAWSPPRGHGASRMVWGRGPDTSGGSQRPLAAVALLREATLLRVRVRAPAGWNVVGVHRVPPRRVGGGAREVVRRLARSGAVVELARPGAPRRVLDAVVAEAGGTGPLERVTFGAGGSLLGRLETRSGRALLRVAPEGLPGGPLASAAALERLATAHIGQVPRLLGFGTVPGATWSTESLLGGRRPKELTDRLVEDVARFLARLPRHEGPPTSVSEDLDVVAAAFPEHADALASIGNDLVPRLTAVPTTTRHGDCWTGNVLAADGRLVGVVDWDSSHPAAPAGVDLLHLLLTAERARTRRPLGSVWLERPWRRREHAAATAGYWEALGTHPGLDELDAVAVAGWAAQVSGDLQRSPGLSQHRRWVADNVEAVLKSIVHG